MGRGSYLGGSTIIGPRTNWSDDDTIWPNDKIISKKKTKRSLKQIKLDFLNLVISSELDGTIITKIPKKSKAALSKLVHDKGGVQNWAESQPQYEKLKAKKLKKKKLKEERVKSRKRKKMKEKGMLLIY